MGDNETQRVDKVASRVTEGYAYNIDIGSPWRTKEKRTNSLFEDKVFMLSM